MGELGLQIPALRVYEKNGGAARLQAVEGLPRDDFQGFVQVLAGEDCLTDIEEGRLQEFIMQQRRGFFAVFMSESYLWRMARVLTRDHFIGLPLRVCCLHKKLPAAHPCLTATVNARPVLRILGSFQFRMQPSRMKYQ